MKKITLMGILNITPDSFSDGGMYFENLEKAVSHARQMVSDGADIIDVGGESTRPGAETISIDEELKRVIPVISEIRQQLGSIQISIDTYKSEVAEKALEAGATMVNSLGGFRSDQKLAEIISKTKSRIVIYHIKGQPKTMQTGEITYSDVIAEISQFFEEQIEIGKQAGITSDQLILDPGIGFGKTVEQNLEIIRRLSEFKKFDLPIMLGISRKRHLGMFLEQKLKLPTQPTETERLEACLAETAVGVLNGATMIRTHDVAETKKFLAVLEEFVPSSL